MKVTAVIERHNSDLPESKINFPGLPPARSRIGTIFEVSADRPEVFCCENMEDAWDKHVVGFGDYETMCNKNTDVNLYEWAIYPEGSFTSNWPIRFCPFCAQPVEVVLVEEEAAERSE
jgi:hypothetical protein